MREGAERKVFVGGVLLGSYADGDSGARNLLLVALWQDPRVRLRKLAAAFEISMETLRQIRQRHEEGGIEAVWRRRPGGAPVKLTAPRRERIERLFEQGLGVTEVESQVGRRYGLARRSIERLRTSWLARRQAQEEKPDGVDETAGGDGQMELLPSEPLEIEETTAASEAPAGQSDQPDVVEHPEVIQIESTAPQSAELVQHAGAWLLVAMVHALGLYEEAFRIAQGVVRRGALRIALDMAVMALAIGQRCIEGTRRLCTPSAKQLLRSRQVPSPSWVRWRLGSFSKELRGADFHVRMLGAYLRRAAAEASDEPVVFYVDNHLRPYRGQHVVRKGWRMQDKRAVAGCSDYYVHDEDGRPLFRVSVPSHDALTDFLTPIARRLREALGPQPRILLCFDRAGAHATQLAELREEGFEFVTYERRPYPALLPSAFGEPIQLRDETVRLAEPARKNLRKGRGRVRRISVLFEQGQQVNLLAISAQPAEWLLRVMVGRWRQENSFKYSGERWGQDQLDGRTVEPYPHTALIPNPARRRLDNALRVARAQEGQLRSSLARLAAGAPEAHELEQDLNACLDLQAELEAQRPSVPAHAPLCETELRDSLVRHTEEYKLTVDTIRIACANAESELAAQLGPLLPRPTEAKKTLANLLGAPGAVHVSAHAITVHLLPAATDAERDAFAQLLGDLDGQRLTLPGDSRPLRFRLPT